MSTDFGTELDAALKGHLDAIREAGARAKAQVEESVAGYSAAFQDEPEDPAFAAPPGYIARGHHGPAVDFGLDETPLEFDAQGDFDADHGFVPEEL